MRYLILLSVFAILSICTLGCGGSSNVDNPPQDASPDNSLQPMPKTVSELASFIISSLRRGNLQTLNADTGTTNIELYMFGPFKTGTRIISDAPIPFDTENKSATAQNLSSLQYENSITIPSSPASASYYVFFVDLYPNYKFQHPVLHGWIRVEDKEYFVKEDGWTFTIHKPGSEEPKPSKVLSEQTVDGVRVIYMSGEWGANQPPIDSANLITYTNLERKALNVLGSDKTQNKAVKKAVVIDLGDKKKRGG